MYVKWVLHDWGDDECVQILNKCREAIPEIKGKVIIVESVIESKPQNVVKEELQLKDLGFFFDMVMMAHTNNGKERTMDEWAYVLAEAGFTRYNVRSISGSASSVIEAFPV